MPRGDKSSYTSKQKRQAEDIEESYERKGVAKAESERRAWATVNKMSGGGLKKKSASKKTATRKTSSRKTVTKKSAVKKVAPAKKSGKGARKSAALKPAAKTNRAVAKTGKVAARGAPKKSQQAGTRATKKTSTELSPRKLSAEAKKNLAARHLWELVEEKKRRAAQPPAWQNIGHHDHAVPGRRPVETAPANSEPAKFHIGGHLDRGDG